MIRARPRPAPSAALAARLAQSPGLSFPRRGRGWPAEREGGRVWGWEPLAWPLAPASGVAVHGSVAQASLPAPRVLL